MISTSTCTSTSSPVGATATKNVPCDGFTLGRLYTLAVDVPSGFWTRISSPFPASRCMSKKAWLTPLKVAMEPWCAPSQSRQSPDVVFRLALIQKLEVCAGTSNRAYAPARLSARSRSDVLSGTISFTARQVWLDPARFGPVQMPREPAGHRSTVYLNVNVLLAPPTPTAQRPPLKLGTSQCSHSPTVVE